MAAPSSTFKPSWFCRDELERMRFIDMNARLLPVNTKMLALILLAIFPAAFVDIEATAVVPAVIGVILFGLLQRAAVRLPHPEAVVFGALLGAQSMIILAVYMYGIADSAAMALTVWPIAGIAGRYARRVLVVGTFYTASLAVAAIVATEPDVIVASPLRVTLIATAIIAAASVCAVLRDSDIDNRGAAILDPLTGMLNRNALTSRIAEIEEQSRLTGNSVGVIVADLDHFKRVNDTHGHAVGDDVLRDVAYLLRRELRAYDLAYRLGGEEFAIVLPGATPEETGELAERLRASIAADQIAGIDVHISAGAACSDEGEAFDWVATFEKADAALYAAKDAGRNRVVVHGAQPREPVAVVA